MITADKTRTGIKAFLIPEFVFDAPLGACMHDPWTGDDNGKLSFVCPGCGKWGGVHCATVKPPPPGWIIVSGSPTDPTTLTLAPSIHCVGCCGWHGYLVEGVFKSC